MRRFFSLTLLALGGVVLAACGSGAVPMPAKPPPRPVETKTETSPHRQGPPQLIAPPPAYGNKIVMARGIPPDFSN
jgi:hypothetical protein